MKNKMTDLTNHLFAQIERLSDEELTGEELAEEIKRSKAITSAAMQINATGKLAIEAEKLRHEALDDNSLKLPQFLEA